MYTLVSDASKGPASLYVTSRYSKREAGWKFNVQIKLATGAKKARQWARPRSPFLRKVISQFVLIVTATAVTQLRRSES